MLEKLMDAAEDLGRQGIYTCSGCLSRMVSMTSCYSPVLIASRWCVYLCMPALFRQSKATLVTIASSRHAVEGFTGMLDDKDGPRRADACITGSGRTLPTTLKLSQGFHIGKFWLQRFPTRWYTWQTSGQPPSNTSTEIYNMALFHHVGRSQVATLGSNRVPRQCVGGLARCPELRAFKWGHPEGARISVWGLPWATCLRRYK
ncbi:unnamed protein product [Polarella glacialis]|uniref:Uncharacterized protein n=1 Tax=Polarella glacialis TaxID=89957 RepID=A0A813JIH8_POLGL|nr:unnamed protein product [Polarella glacialis]